MKTTHHWRVALAIRAARVERRLGEAMTDDQWRHYEETSLGSDRLLLRELLHRNYEFGVSADSELAHQLPWNPPLRFVPRH